MPEATVEIREAVNAPDAADMPLLFDLRIDDPHSAAARNRTDWMPKARFGLMVHWLYPNTAPAPGQPASDRNDAEDFNAVVDDFDVDRFLADFDASGADFLMFTTGQNSGYYISPNRVLEHHAGPNHTSRRDLLLEIASGVRSLEKRFIAYLPSEVHFQSESIREAFAWNPHDQTEFQRRYTAFIREYSERLGSRLDGWWFDGCYDWEFFHHSLYDWRQWCDAARAGNPDAAIAFNDGSFYLRKLLPVSPYQDYLSGEIGLLQDGQIRLGRETETEGTGELYLPSQRYVPGTFCQWHGQVPIDCLWVYGGGAMPAPRYTDAELLAFLRHCRSVGGVVTFNVGIYRDGRLAEETVAQLRRIACALDA